VTIKTISSNLASQISVNHAAENTTTTCTEQEKVRQEHVDAEIPKVRDMID
jgi:hypothetical protein